MINQLDLETANTIHYMNHWDEENQRMIKTIVGGTYKIHFKKEARTLISQMETMCLWESNLSDKSKSYLKDIVDKYLLDKFTSLTQEMENHCDYPFYVKEGEIKHKTCYNLSFDMYKKALDKYKILEDNDYDKWVGELNQEHRYEKDIFISNLFYEDVEKWVSKVYSENTKMLISNLTLTSRLSECYKIFDISFIVDHPNGYTNDYVNVVNSNEDFLFTEELDSSKIFPMKDGSLLSVKEVLEYGKTKPRSSYHKTGKFNDLLIETGIDNVYSEGDYKRDTDKILCEIEIYEDKRNDMLFIEERVVDPSGFVYINYKPIEDTIRDLASAAIEESLKKKY